MVANILRTDTFLSLFVLALYYYSYPIINMSFPKSILLFTACAASVFAQSANPGLGTNPDAQGATSEVTPGTGPNG